MEENNNELMQQVQRLAREVEALKSRRITQQDIPTGTVKQRHINEGIIYVRSGLAAARPTTPELSQNGVAMYFATDTFVLSISTGTAWKSVTLS